LEAVNLNNVNVPTYLIYAADATDCGAELNKLALDSVAGLKRTITYDDHNQLTFYKNQVLDSEESSGKKPSDDVIIILGSGATALFATWVSALALLNII